jgi:hypothetical protein
MLKRKGSETVEELQLAKTKGKIKSEKLYYIVEIGLLHSRS